MSDKSLISAGLILEGGGMRGVYTAGVLDFFLDQGLRFQTVYGVSAGSCHACSYLAGQRERAYHTVADYAADPAWGSWQSWRKTGDYFNVEMIYDKIPNQLIPYDYEAYDDSESEFYAVVTNIESGQAEYLRVTDMHEHTVMIQASSSLPLLSRIVEIGGKKYLDGGIADAIPLQRSLTSGQAYNVLVLTQHHGYRKGPNRLLPVLRRHYRDYPNFLQCLANRHTIYNATLDLIASHQSAGQAFVIQPRKPVTIKRFEKDARLLQQLYEDGYQDAADSYPALQAFLQTISPQS